VKKERERERDREGKKRKESNAPLASFLALSTTSTSNLLDLLHLLNNQTKPSQGETRMLLTKIPHFRELMVCSFECPHCGHRNNEITFAGMFGEKGSIHTLKVAENDRASRDRQVVKSETASVKVPELDFEIPAGTQSGTITTVEGILTEAATAMRSQQELRKIEDPEGAAALETFLEKLDAAASGGTAFTLIVDDPAGNAGVESTGPGDRELSVTHYERSNEQAAAVGLLPDASKEQDAKEKGKEEPPSSSKPFTKLDPSEIHPDDPHHGHAPLGAAAAHRALARLEGERAEKVMSRYAAPEEVMEMPGHCGACGGPTTTRMYRTEIPFFKEVILMSDACDGCGYRNSEVKGGGGVPPKGRKIELRVEKQEDLRRDVIKAETATLSIPELELEVTTGTLGGLITTVEGLVESVAEALKKTQGFALGDGAQSSTAKAWKDFFEGLRKCACLEDGKAWTLRLVDPLANSFISGLDVDPDEGEEGEEEEKGKEGGGGKKSSSQKKKDERLSIEDYERSAEENADFGIDFLMKHAAINDAGGEVELKEEDEEEGEEEGEEGSKKSC